MIDKVTNYNIYFDVCAVLFDLVFLILVVTRKKVKGRRDRVFMYMVLTIMIAAMMEVGTSLIRNGDWIMSNYWRTIINVLAHFFQNSLSFLVYMYVLQIFGVLRHLSFKRKVFISIPEMALMIFLLVPQLRRLIFYYDEAGIYQRGPVYKWVYYCVILVYLIAGICALMKYRNRISKQDFMAISHFVVAMILSILAEGLFPGMHLRITIFLQSLCFFGAYICLENDEEAIDNETGLLSRYSLWNDLGLMYESEYSSYLISVNLNNYEYYLQTIGSKRMNILLKNVSQWLAKLSSDKVSVYHPKSGTFALVLYDFDRDNALKYADKIRGRFTDEWIVEGASVFFQPLVKMTGVPQQIRKDEQLYAFIENGSIEGMVMNSVNFIDEVSSSQRRLQIEMALDRAIKNDTLQVYYQPIYDVATGRIRSCEALVRMDDEELGMVSPEEFIKVAEKTGQINFIGEIVFEKVCQFLKEQTPQKYGMEYVEVNLSTVECMNPMVPSTIRSLMNKYGIDKSQISIEITESAVIHNKETMANVMDNMQRAGLSFALDDFGTGNANFSYVLDYNFDIIKIDKTFLWAADGSEENAAILEAMLQLIKGLKRKAVVEGVETEKQRDYLVSKGVEFLQGYYYSKPLPEREFIDFIRRYN